MSGLGNPPRSRGGDVPGGTSSHDAILSILVTPITSLGETSEISELLRLFVTDKISEEALTAHAATESPEEHVEQSSKRVRKDDYKDTLREEATGESALRPQ
jgi:hypothetical protein